MPQLLEHMFLYIFYAHYRSQDFGSIGMDIFPII